MNRKLKSTVLAAAGMLVLAASQAQAAWPEKPVRVVVPFAAGGPADFVARLLGQKLSEQWKQPVVIDNRGGAGGNLGTVLAAQAQGDGYTLLLTTSVFISNPSLYKKTGYELPRVFRTR